MTATRDQTLIGKQVLICFKTTHHDRAGETFSQVAKLGEIVAVDASGWVVVDTANAEHIRCPRSKLYRVPAEGFPVALTPEERRAITFLGRPAEPDYFAAEELIRDFHSATRPITLRWLGRAAALLLCQAIAHPTA